MLVSIIHAKSEISAPPLFCWLGMRQTRKREAGMANLWQAPKKGCPWQSIHFGRSIAPQKTPRENKSCSKSNQRFTAEHYFLFSKVGPKEWYWGFMMRTCHGKINTFQLSFLSSQNRRSMVHSFKRIAIQFTLSDRFKYYTIVEVQKQSKQKSKTCRHFSFYWNKSLQQKDYSNLFFFLTGRWSTQQHIWTGHSQTVSSHRRPPSHTLIVLSSHNNVCVYVRVCSFITMCMCMCMLYVCM